MTEEDIQRTIAAFADAARRADKAGFDVVEIHAAHGYLIHQFLSTASNTRTDRLGWQSRKPHALRASRSPMPSAPPGPRASSLFVRISGVDGANG